MAAPQCIRLARIEEASALSELCIRSKAAWGYDEAFMALARAVLQVSPGQIAAGDVWVATGVDREVTGMVALGPSEQRNTLDLDKLFVEPKHIRTGVGRALIAHAIDEARRRGAKRLTSSLILTRRAFTNAMARAELVRRPPTPSPAERCRSTK
jgi:GNAT superfamily N-acetyltransferase